MTLPTPLTDDELLPAKENYDNRIINLRQIADELDTDAACPPCMQAAVIREAADELHRLRQIVPRLEAWAKGFRGLTLMEESIVGQAVRLVKEIAGGK